MNNVPYIRLEGFFEFKSPVSDVVKSNVPYKIVAIRDIRDLIDSNEEPFETIYEKIKLSKDVFDRDYKNNVSVVTLLDAAGDYTYVPENVITKAPDIDGELYSNRLMVVNLGKLPENFNLIQIKKSIEDAILYGINLKVEAKEVINSATEVINDVDHNEFLRKTVHGPDRADTYEDKYRKLKIKYDELFNLIEETNKGIKLNIENKKIDVVITK